ncbi:hypothetical protein [Acaryochloris sp. IP29b_bin.148]|uniref:hypothetical protein n=1 Tax=Acaryochloris sp. IP29b_bin.148 TaxID=2969218 RepID=UPI002604A5FB|nr:hypothetical protein [Acaryochloris sp. IP29b_bin.148]
MGPPCELLEKLKMELSIQNFIETGTYKAETAIRASSIFKNIFTIEFSQKLYNEAIQSHGAIDNIDFRFGNSKEELAKIIPQLNGTSLFWLDAHWSGGVTFGSVDECPLLDELNIINSRCTDSVILIDDARLFTSPPPLPHNVDQWPDISTVIESLQSYSSKRYVVIIEDVIVAVPEHAKTLVKSYCQQVNTKHWEEYKNQSYRSDIKKGLKLIYSGLKKKALSMISS